LLAGGTRHSPLLRPFDRCEPTRAALAALRGTIAR
jgi:hypothetical protein